MIHPTHNRSFFTIWRHDSDHEKDRLWVGCNWRHDASKSWFSWKIMIFMTFHLPQTIRVFSDVKMMSQIIILTSEKTLMVWGKGCRRHSTVWRGMVGTPDTLVGYHSLRAPFRATSCTRQCTTFGHFDVSKWPEDGAWSGVRGDRPRHMSCQKFKAQSGLIWHDMCRDLSCDRCCIVLSLAMQHLSSDRKCAPWSLFCLMTSHQLHTFASLVCIAISHERFFTFRRNLSTAQGFLAAGCSWFEHVVTVGKPVTTLTHNRPDWAWLFPEMESQTFNFSVNVTFHFWKKSGSVWPKVSCQWVLKVHSFIHFTTTHFRPDWAWLFRRQNDDGSHHSAREKWPRFVAKSAPFLAENGDQQSNLCEGRGN